MTKIKVNENGIPRELQQLNRWLTWKEKPRANSNKLDKFPQQVGGAPCSSVNPKHWTDFDSAMEAAEDKGCGLGFAIVESDGYVWVDLDDAVGQGWGQKVIAETQSYTELSPSGTGYHICVKGAKTIDRCKRALKNKAGQKFGEIECYSKDRFFTITGETLPGKEDIIEDQEFLDFIFEFLEPEKKPEPIPESKKEHKKKLTAQNIVDAVNHSKQFAKFDVLMQGPESKILSDYPSMSEAVMALCNIVAFYTDDYDVATDIFKASACNNQKWGKKWYHPKQGVATWDRAVAECTTVYSGGKDNSEESEESEDSLYHQHIELARELYPEFRKDLFTGDLYCRKSPDAEWQNAFESEVLQVLKAECLLKGKPYGPTKMEPFLYKLLFELEPQMLVDVPVWDERDRIHEMCQVLNFEAPITNDVFEDLFKDWCAKLFKKLKNPTHYQNRCVILSGQQGVGKDVWVQSMFCSAGHHMADFTMKGAQSNEAELAQVVSSNLVVFISEFDKTGDIHIAALKDLITKPSFFFRAPYARKPSRHYNRGSLIAACNPQHILRDATGNRRFLIFRLKGGPKEAIKWEYPTNDMNFSAQCLAQMQLLAGENYKASESSEAIVREQIQKYTPDSAEDEVIEAYNEELSILIERSGQKYWRPSDKKLAEVFDRISRQLDVRIKEIQTQLKAHGCQYRRDNGRYYTLKEFATAEMFALHNPSDVGVDISEEVPF